MDRLLDAAGRVFPAAATELLSEVCEILGARSAKLFVADYSLHRLQRMDADGPVDEPQPILGTVRGRAFTTGRTVVSDAEPVVLAVPLIDGTVAIGVLELEFDEWDGSLDSMLARTIEVYMLLVVDQNRYSDLWPRARRSIPLSPAAEVQWDLLPPLACSAAQFELGGLLQPAYDIGGDSFDYAVNGHRLELAIVDAVGRGMPAVLMAAAMINSLRNSRRLGADLAAAYEQAGGLMAAHFGDFQYVTGVIGFLDVSSGHLTWINAGHPPPMLVRNGTFAGYLECAPSTPLGLRGGVSEVATVRLHRGDRVLFYTDGLVESRSADGVRFGEEKLTDLLVRATLEKLPVPETLHRLSENILLHSSGGLHDDATLLLLEFSGG